MQKFRWQLLIVLITGLVVGLILFFQQSQTTQEAVSTPNPISGGRYTEALVGNFLRLNPMLDHFNQADCDIDKLIFSSLIRFDSNGLPVGDLAESWSVSSDAAVFIFNLRLDAVWHDGQPVTAQDVIYTVSLLQSGSNLIPEDLREIWTQSQSTRFLILPSSLLCGLCAFFGLHEFSSASSSLAWKTEPG